MTLRQRQIQAVKATLEQVKEEYRWKEFHHWDRYKCPLCEEFVNEVAWAHDERCPDCPSPLGCSVNCAEITLADLAGFLQSLLVSL